MTGTAECATIIAVFVHTRPRSCMKRKISVALAVFFLLFLVSGIYVITAKEKACAKLDNLVRLHRIEILRGHLLIHLKWVQSDLQLRNTRHARSLDTLSEHVAVLQSITPSCFTCHHAPAVTGKIERLRDDINEYQAALRGALSGSGDKPARRIAEDRALRIGANLIIELDELTTMTNRKLSERTDRAFAEITRTNTMIYLLLGIVPTIALVAAVLFIRRFTAPVEKLLIATRRLKAGDLGHRISGLNDEYGEVAESFNEMAEALQIHLSRMQWAEQLVLLCQVSGGLAHDMKNPLAGIKVSMKVLSRDRTLSVENREALLKALDQICHIENHIKNLLDIARQPKRRILPVQLNALMDTAIDVISKHPSFFAVSARKPIRIERVYDPFLPTILADPFELQQIFMNLLLNAAEAMPGGGSVTINTAADLTVPSVSVSVTDTGCGIAEHISEDIFRPFFTTKTEGTGLGLAICKRLVEAAGGCIQARNNPAGGAVFTVTLPICRDISAAEGIAGQNGSGPAPARFCPAGEAAQ